MVQIPAFETREDYPHGVLPDGVHPCDEAALRVVLGSGFEGSRTRGQICEGFINYRDRVGEYGISATQWIDGSFVERKTDPADVDVVSFCDYDALNDLVASIHEVFLQLIAGGEATKPVFGTHSFCVPSCPVGHPYRETFEESRLYWRRWFGKTREIARPQRPPLPGQPKGFLQMVIGDDAPIIEKD